VFHESFQHGCETCELPDCRTGRRCRVASRCHLGVSFGDCAICSNQQPLGPRLGRFRIGPRLRVTSACRGLCEGKLRRKTLQNHDGARPHCFGDEDGCRVKIAWHGTFDEGASDCHAQKVFHGSRAIARIALLFSLLIDGSGKRSTITPRPDHSAAIQSLRVV